MSTRNEVATHTLECSVRPRGLFGKIEVFVDNEFLTCLKKRETKSVKIPYGSHQLRARAFPFGQCQNISFELQPNTQTVFEISVSDSSLFGYLGVAVLLIVPNLLEQDFHVPSAWSFLLLWLGWVIIFSVWNYWFKYRRGKGLTIRQIYPEPK